MHTHVLVLFSDPADPTLPRHVLTYGVRGQVRDRRYRYGAIIRYCGKKADAMKALALAQWLFAMREVNNETGSMTALLWAFAALKDGPGIDPSQSPESPKHPSWKRCRRDRRQFGNVVQLRKDAWLNQRAA